MPNQDDDEDDEGTASGVVVVAAGRHRPSWEGKGERRSKSKRKAGNVAARARLKAWTAAQFLLHRLFLATSDPQYHSSHFPLTHLKQTTAFGPALP